MKTLFTILFVSLFTPLWAEAHAEHATSQEVNLYSARKEALLRPLLDAFTRKTGIKVNIISSKADALLKRIQTEAHSSPADVLLTSDAGRLWRAKNARILATVKSTTLTNNIPSQYRDPDNQWFGLSLRARPIMVNKQYTGVLPSTYADLANPEFKHAICIRSSNNIYNQSLVASMLIAHGQTATQDWANALVKNFARKPQGGDRDQIRAAALGVCPIAIANTYYLAAMLSPNASKTDRKAARSLRIIWPNQNNRGTHVNVSGGAVLKFAPNPANAIKLLEFLSSDIAQKIYADINYEYPVKTGIELNPILQAWGEFKADSINLNLLGKNNAEAVKIMDKANWK